MRQVVNGARAKQDVDFGTRARMALASRCAMQPATPMTRLGLLSLRRRRMPSSEYSLCSGFSRTAQVFIKMTSASCASGVGS
jgi:hypothetical protein